MISKLNDMNVSVKMDRVNLYIYFLRGYYGYKNVYKVLCYIVCRVCYVDCCVYIFILLS